MSSKKRKLDDFYALKADVADKRRRVGEIRQQLDEEMKQLEAAKSKLAKHPKAKKEKREQLRAAISDQLKTLSQQLAEVGDEKKEGKEELAWLAMKSTANLLDEKISFGQETEAGSHSCDFVYNVVSYRMRETQLSVTVREPVDHDAPEMPEFLDDETGQFKTLAVALPVMDRRKTPWLAVLENCDVKWHLALFCLRHWSDLIDLGEFE